MLKLLVINNSPSSPAINKLHRLLPAISVNLPRSSGAVFITPSRSQRWQHAMEPDIGSESRNIAMTYGMKKPEWWGYATVTKIWRCVCSFRHSLRTWQTDRQTDWRTPHDGIGRACIASRGRNYRSDQSERVNSEVCSDCPWGNHAKCCMDGKRFRCLQIVLLYVPISL